MRRELQAAQYRGTDVVFEQNRESALSSFKPLAPGALPERAWEVAGVLVCGPLAELERPQPPVRAAIAPIDER